jgi:ubiquitin-like protein Pup
MAQREQVKKQARKSEASTVAEAVPATDKGQALKDEMDDLLDSIDEVLETNAAEFVRSYVQKGGE